MDVFRLAGTSSGSFQEAEERVAAGQQHMDWWMITQIQPVKLLNVYLGFLTEASCLARASLYTLTSSITQSMIDRLIKIPIRQVGDERDE